MKNKKYLIIAGLLVIGTFRLSRPVAMTESGATRSMNVSGWAEFCCPDIATVSVGVPRKRQSLRLAGNTESPMPLPAH